MNTGVIYFNSGDRCVLRILVSIHSLRKFYNGPVTVILDADTHVDLFNSLKDVNTIVGDFKRVKEGKNVILLRKSCVNDYTPYDINVFLDADTLVRGKFNELFELAAQHEFVVPQFCDWTTKTKAIVRRIEGWRMAYPDLMDTALNFGPAVNCGIFAFRKNAKFMLDWYKRIEPGRENFIPDETGMQVVLHQYKHFVADQKFNCSCKYSTPKDPDTRIIHYHGKKHCRMDKEKKIIYNGDLWVQEYQEMLSDKMVSQEVINKFIGSDKMMKRIGKSNIDAEEEEKLPHDITIVTAVNPPYLEKLKLSLPTWKIKPQFKNCPIIVFHNGFEGEEPKELLWIKDHFADVKLVPWDMDFKDITNRELMLSAFVFGSAALVQTPYFVKIDGDTYFSGSQDVFLEHHFNYDIAGHKWRYSKPGKWLVELDEWAEQNDIDGECYLKDDKQREEATKSHRYGHKRIASWICLHKTSFIIEVAHLAGDRLPVASHDTYCWYMAERLPDRKWCWHNFKKMAAGTHTNIEVIKEAVKDK